MTSEDFQKRLERSLRNQLAGFSSPEYALVWKEWVMPLGPPICALRASQRHTSGKGSIGWATENYNEAGDSCNSRKTKQLVGWPTPQTVDSQNARAPRLKTTSHHPSPRDPEKLGNYRADLKDVAQMAGWATPTGRDHKDGSSAGTAPVNGLLGRQVWDSGTTTNSSPAPTEKRGALNPALSRWLQGLPVAWCQAAIRASRKLKTQARRG